MLDKKVFGGNLALKIDIVKAFDTLDRDFLISVLNKFGYSHTFCNWIRVILLSAKLSISVNGEPVGFFSCQRGVRQGDPLSPSLYRQRCLEQGTIYVGFWRKVASYDPSQWGL